MFETKTLVKEIVSAIKKELKAYREQADRHHKETMMMDDRNWMTVKECAEWLRMGESTLRKNTTIPRTMVGGMILFSRVHIIQLINENKI